MLLAFEVIGATQLRQLSIITVCVMAIWVLIAPLVTMVECGPAKLDRKWMCAGEVSARAAKVRARTLTTEAGAAPAHDPDDRRLVGCLAGGAGALRRLDPERNLGQQAQGGVGVFMQAAVSHEAIWGAT